jgi:hypothetical protein
LNTNWAASLLVVKSISVPSRNSTAFGSTKTRTPRSSTTSSPGLGPSAYSIVYDMPAQPPLRTPTRRPAIGRSASAMIALIRSAARSVSERTLNPVDIVTLPPNRVQGPGTRILTPIR